MKSHDYQLIDRWNERRRSVPELRRALSARDLLRIVRLLTAPLERRDPSNTLTTAMAWFDDDELTALEQWASGFIGFGFATKEQASIAATIATDARTLRIARNHKIDK